MLIISEGLMAALGFMVAMYPGQLLLLAIAVVSIMAAVALLINGTTRRRREARVAGLR